MSDFETSGDASEAGSAEPPKKPPVKKIEIFGWAMYDFANSSYTTVVISLLYSAFFTAHIVPPGEEVRDTYWSVAIIASTILAIVLSPLVGAICDYSGSKKRYLFFSTVVCAVSTMGLALVEPGNVWLAIALITVSNAAFMIGEAFCGSFLTDLATKKTMGIISGLGWGLGYFGGLASLIIVQLLVVADPSSDLAAYVSQNQWAMVAIGIFFFCAAMPTFLLVKERSTPAPGFENASMAQLVSAGLAELKQTANLARQYNVLFRFFLAFTVYMAGLEVVIKFIGIYATAELSLATSDLITLFLILQISAAAGALAFGFLEARLGAKPTVLATIAWWIVGVLAIFFLDDLAAFVGTHRNNVFFGIAVIAGGGIGSIQSSSRAVVGILSPSDRSAQMFGFWGMFSRLAIILGMSFGFFADAIGSRRHALLLVVAFFAIGGLMLLRVPISNKDLQASHQT
jgi:UMF1 family MFS transporter